MYIVAALLLAQSHLPNGEYVFVPYSRTNLGRPYLTWTLGNADFLGWVSDHGEFIPDDKAEPAVGLRFVSGSGRKQFRWAEVSREPVYEFRSGRLISGSLENWIFTPELDAKIVDFTTYKYVPKESRRIYNLPGRFVAKEALADSNKTVAPSPNCAATGNARENQGAAKRPFTVPPAQPGRMVLPPNPADMRYVKEPNAVYWHKWGERIFLGSVNEAGDFIPDLSVKPQRPEEFKGGPPGDLLTAGRPNEPVYEYRGARLIPGVLDAGHFVPDLGGKVIEFKDYQPLAKARRIYNLPGRYITKNEYEALKAAGKIKDE